MIDPAQALTSNTADSEPLCRRGAGYGDQVDLDDGYIHGRAVPYGKTVELKPGLREHIKRGAFAKADPKRVFVHYNHDYSARIGRVTDLVERDDGLYFTARISQHPGNSRAAQALAELEDGLVDEVSVGFNTVKGGSTHHTEGGVTTFTHHRARLMEISVVAFGAYGEDARITRARDIDVAAELLAARRAEFDAWRATQSLPHALRSA